MGQKAILCSCRGKFKVAGGNQLGEVKCEGISFGARQILRVETGFQRITSGRLLLMLQSLGINFCPRDHKTFNFKQQLN